MKTRATYALLIAALIATNMTAQAEPRDKRNYILRRQEIGAVQGTPTLKLINGKREIDVYPNGLMFDKDNVVGVRR
jgi:hypothetical protein